MPLKKDSKMSSTENVSGSFNSDHKILIREKWNKPLIKFLSKKVNDRLIYMGLPSSNAEDLTHWIDFIKVVISFQCREYGKKSDPQQSRAEIEKLENFLNKLEREKKLDQFVVYDGYLEEVVLRGYDNSPDKILFDQSSYITMYNLDFCNDIASPIEFTDIDGNPKTAYKFNAIQELLHIQRKLSNVSNKFVFLLTVHCSYNGKELHDFINNPPNGDISGYLNKYKSLKGHEKNARIVRLFVCHQIMQCFPACGFSYQILPVIMYNGLGGTPLLHFVILGTQPQYSASGVPNYQSFNSVIDQRFISIDASSFINGNSELEEIEISQLDPLNYFTTSATYQKLWQ